MFWLECLSLREFVKQGEGMQKNSSKMFVLVESDSEFLGNSVPFLSNGGGFCLNLQFFVELCQQYLHFLVFKINPTPLKKLTHLNPPKTNLYHATIHTTILVYNLYATSIVLAIAKAITNRVEQGGVGFINHPYPIMQSSYSNVLNYGYHTEYSLS